MVTLLAAGGDGPLVDPALPPVPLRCATTPPGGKLVRDLPMGALIGRRAQLRTAMAVLRGDPAAVDRFGVARRGGADRDRGDRQDRAGRAGHGPAGR